MTILISLALIALVIFLLVWSTSGLAAQAKKDWAFERMIREKANQVTTLEEVKALHAELIEGGNKIQNEYVRASLNHVEGYLRGMYKILNKDTIPNV